MARDKITVRPVTDLSELSVQLDASVMSVGDLRGAIHAINSPKPATRLRDLIPKSIMATASRN